VGPEQPFSGSAEKNATHRKARGEDLESKKAFACCVLEDYAAARKLLIMPKEAANAAALIETLGTDFLAGVMFARDLNSRDMDQMCGFRPGHFCEQRTRNFPGEESKAIIENRLMVRIWDSEQRFNLRMACQRRYQFDPCLLTVPELKRWVRQLDIAHRVPPSPTRDQLISGLLQHLAVNPHKKP
jgi:hypothetical protein